MSAKQGEAHTESHTAHGDMSAHHFIDLSTVVLLNVSQYPDVITLDKVDCNTLQHGPNIMSMLATAIHLDHAVHGRRRRVKQSKV